MLELTFFYFRCLKVTIIGLSDEILRLREELNFILSKNTKQSLKKIEKDTDRNFFMSSDEAKKYGLIDSILTTRK